MTNAKFENKIFWKEDFDGEKAQGGFHYRAFDLIKFLESVENADNGGEVVGIKFEDNNLEVIFKPKHDE